MNTIVTPRPAVVSIAAALSSIALCPLAVQADTSAQTQKAIQAVCSRAATGYGKRDLSSFVAMYSPSFMVRNVAGRKANFRQNQAGLANLFAKNNLQAKAVCSVSQVIPQGSQARATLHWHYVTQVQATTAYTVTRDYQEQSLWKKTAGGWQEVSADLTRDTIEYRR